MRGGAIAGGLAALVLLSAVPPAAGEPTPITLSAQFTPPYDLDFHTQHGRAGAAPACRIRIGEVRDVRGDTQSMGEVGFRVVRASDSAGWIKSALQSLDRDPRLALDAAPDPADLVVGAELLKAYIISITSDKSTSVVLRVRFTGRDGASAEQIFRGVETSMDWSESRNETQGQFDRALAQIVEQVDQNLIRRCATSP